MTTPHKLCYSLLLFLFLVLIPLFVLGMFTQQTINITIEETKQNNDQDIEYIQTKKYRIHHRSFPIDSIKQEYVNYAYEISGGDIQFLGTLQAENDRRHPHRQSTILVVGGPNGYEDSRGFCQIHQPSHPDIIANELFWTDWKRQMKTCYSLYTGGTYFAGKAKAKSMYDFFMKIYVE